MGHWHEFTSLQLRKKGEFRCQSLDLFAVAFAQHGGGKPLSEPGLVAGLHQDLHHPLAGHAFATLSQEEGRADGLSDQGGAGLP